MLELVRGMPTGVRFFVAYGFILLAIIGLALPAIVELAVQAPVTGPGLVAMLLLAYAVFTLTLVLQRKRAALWFAYGLSSLTVPAALFFVLAEAFVPALLSIALAAGLFLGLTRPSARAWFDQP